MRRIAISLITISFVLVVFSSAAVLKTRAKGEPAILVPQPGTRCTRLTYGPKPKKKMGEVGSGSAGPGTRCTRLSSGGREGTILPNTPPNIGLATSTAYIAGAAPSQVKLKAIACDADNDTLLYTYSTTGGRISGDGAAAVWDLSGVSRPGTYTVSVEVDDGCGCMSFDSSSVTLE